MPIIKSAIKRAKQSIKRRARNVETKKDIKDATKAFIAKPTAAGFSAAQSEIDTAVKKGLIKKNTAARRKMSLSKIAKAAGVKFTSTKKAAPAVQRTKVAAAKPATIKKTTVKAVPAVKKPTATKKTAVKKSAK